MHRIKGTLKHIVEDTKRDDGKPYKVLQILSPEFGLIHQIDGEIVSTGKGTMDGRECQTIRLLSNGGKFMITEKIVDYDLDRTWKLGQNTVYGLPVVKQRAGKPFLMFELVPDQKEPEQKMEGEVFLCAVKDWENRDWKTGPVTVAVRNKPFISVSGRGGVNYTALENQG